VKQASDSRGLCPVSQEDLAEIAVAKKWDLFFGAGLRLRIGGPVHHLFTANSGNCGEIG